MKTYNNNLLETFERAKKLAYSAQNYREWLESKGYNVKCENFTVDVIGNIQCTCCKPLILCNGRCRYKTN